MRRVYRLVPSQPANGGMDAAGNDPASHKLASTKAARLLSNFISVDINHGYGPYFSTPHLFDRAVINNYVLGVY